MSKNEPKTSWTSNPLAKHNKRPSTTDKRRLSTWFVNNQKSEAWGQKALNTLHVQIVILLVLVYACHVIGSPFIRFVEDHNALTIIYILETIILAVSILCFVKMCFVNGSWTATKLLFDKTSVRTYIFAFWLIRSFVIEILKGQVIYSFVLSFHSILIFATDTWYMCDRKVLLFSMVLYLVLVVYEFLVSISPVGPTKPSWQFMNIETTANSLSRSNYFNLFVIFFDAIIVVIYDVNRSKYAMLVKKRQREMLEVPPSKERVLKRLWMLVTIAGLLLFISYIMESAFKMLSNIYPGLDNVITGIFFSLSIGSYIIVAWLSSSRKVLYFLVQERRVIFIVILLGILFYVDNIVVYGWTSAAHITYPLQILCYISLDMIIMYFPRRLSLAMMVIIIVLNLWNIVNNTFRKTDCKQYMLPWGIFGENISYCTIKRLIFQTIVSLLVSAAIAIFAGRTDNLFFCNQNIYRSTGTIDRHALNQKYVSSMRRERARSIDAEKTNIELELT